MSSRVKKAGKKMKGEYSKMYMDVMYELFSLSVFQLLKLRHQYLSHMKAREKEHRRLVKTARRRGIRI